MILSRGRRYLFVHAPKTGGTSLSLALEARAMKDDILVGDTPKARRRRARQAALVTHGRLWKHSTLADLGGLVGEGELEALFVVTLVRNPWDRMVSYYHWLGLQSFAHPAVSAAKALPFADFLRHPAVLGPLRAMPYGAYVRDGAGRERADLFIRLEHLETDIAPFEAHLGFALSPLPHVNAAPRALGDYRAHYGPDEAALVAEACAEDIARFGYVFG